MKGSEQIRWEQIAANMIDLKKRSGKDQIDHIELEQKRSDRIGTERVVRVGTDRKGTECNRWERNGLERMGSDRIGTERNVSEMKGNHHKGAYIIEKNRTVRIKRNGSKLKEHIPPT